MKQRNVILVIDDEPTLRETLKDLFTIHGYPTLLAADGNNGLELAHKYAPRLIVCDVNMPGMSGFEVARQLRKHPAARQTPFIFMSAAPPSGSSLSQLRLGLDAYMSKPFEQRKLLALVRDRLDLSNTMQQRSTTGWVRN